MNAISLRDYAAKEGISLGTAYRRLWEGRVSATKCDGRWLILTSTGRTEEGGRDGKADPPPSDAGGRHAGMERGGDRR